jgi:hypothetical protein
MSKNEGPAGGKIKPYLMEAEKRSLLAVLYIIQDHQNDLGPVKF